MDYSTITEKILSSRGIVEEVDVIDFFLKEYKLTNPYLLPSMRKAVARIKDAIEKEEKIIICGDYDVDGMLGASILTNYLNTINANVDLHLPDREKDGYGMSPEQVEYLYKEKNADLLISVDNGISAFSSALKAKELGVDLIITDHHEIPQEGLPEATAIINPKLLKNDAYNLKILAGSGVAFYLVRALNSSLFPNKEDKPSIINYLVLATVGTIADMVPLVDDNRILVHKGLEYLYRTDLFGFKELLKLIKFWSYPNASDLSFYLSPALNAPGRLGCPELTIDLLTTNSIKGKKIAKKIINTNIKRREMTAEQTTIALKDKSHDNDSVFISVSKDYHLGLIGLIANKVSEEKQKVALIGTPSGDLYKFSGRRVGGIDLKQVLDSLSDFHDGGGGHAAAIGFSVHKDKLENFIEEVKKKSSDFPIETKRDFDFSCFFDEIHSDQVIKEFFHLEPFGQGNPIPKLNIKGIKFSTFKKIKNQHVKFTTPKAEILSFFMSKKEMEIAEQIAEEDLTFDAIGEVSSNGQTLKITLEKITKTYP